VKFTLTVPWTSAVYDTGTFTTSFSYPQVE
jgi:hypothetical protein